MTCGIFHGDGCGAPKDRHGCVLPTSHGGQPHEFVGSDGVKYQWETDLLCDCEHRMLGGGDYCTTYWPKEKSVTRRSAARKGGDDQA